MRWLVLAALAAACSRRADVVDWQRMKDQSQMKAMPYAASRTFADGRAMRAPPAGTVPRERAAAGAPRPAVDAALVARGRQRFDITCAACHGLLGDGVSEVARHMTLRRPPSLHEPRIRSYPDERLHDVISRGFGLMPSYAPHLSDADRWAVVAYVRALQLSQGATLAELPPEVRAEADHALAGGRP